ncbi:sulfotransferase family 2 domain-containing protein [Marinicella gelatinilytica]|uniref:sulfotransferase family 2 domain-containing protein n=1 Tax=Marinicella gelatinilytica TaxID=2996017 RepID=UPI002260D197|nr:sulfotransferase family 2 domain-containing protein [Marinicella gelatinilytica]MCX7544476.1 sulfotransferase family 2 domain-containing protein [Marinicella gelatinilytica]
MKAWFKQFFKSPKQPVYYFAHIPKTAGTSFIVLLDRYFSAKSIMPQQLWREVTDLEELKKQNHQLIRGHFGGGGAKMLTAQDLRHLTMVRDPVDLSHSTYEFIKREQNTVVHDLVHREQLSFEDFLIHPKTQPLVSNRMVRYLSFDFEEDPSAQEVFLSPQTVEDLQPLLTDNQVPLNDDQRLQRAKQWLDHAFWFGLLERFDDAMRFLSYRMVLPPVGNSQKLNKHKSRPVISDVARQRVLANNQADGELYDYARSQFEHHYTQMLHDLGLTELANDDDIDVALDKHYQNNYLQRHKHVLARSISFQCGDVLLGQNWHRREWIAEQQTFFRWSGPGQLASLDFWLEPHDYDMTIEIINALSESLLDDLIIQANGHDLDWSSEDVGVVRTLHLKCPQSNIQDNGLLRLYFQSPQVMSHAEAFGSDDQRRIAFALKAIQVKIAA